MKITVIAPLLIVFIAGITLTNCNNTPEQKVEQAKENVNDAKQDLNDAQNKYNEEWQKFKDEYELKISDNEKTIAEFKEKIKNEKKDVKARHERMLTELENNNREMRTRLGEYKDQGKENWENFKRDFTASMDKLGQSFKELFSDKN